MKYGSAKNWLDSRERLLYSRSNETPFRTRSSQPGEKEHMRATLHAVLGVAFWLHSIPLRADVLVSTSLAHLLARGPVEFLSPWTAPVFAQAENSRGGFHQNFDPAPVGGE